jgi:hypothetical protein
MYVYICIIGGERGLAQPAPRQKGREWKGESHAENVSFLFNFFPSLPITESTYLDTPGGGRGCYS